MTDRGRHWAARGLVLAASAALVLALVAGYTRRAAVDSDQFANRATAALRDDSVRSLVAERITDDVVLKNESDLIAARPIIESVAAAVVGSRAFTSLFRSAVRDVHRALFDRDQDTRHPHGRGRRDGPGRGARAGAALARARASSRPSGCELRQARHRKRRAADLARARRPRPAARARAAGARAPARRRRAGGLARPPPHGRGARHRRRRGRRPAGRRATAVAALARDRPRRGCRGPGRGRRGLGRVPRRPAHRRVDPGRLGAVIAAAAASLIRPVDIGEPLRRAAAWLATEPRRPALRRAARRCLRRCRGAGPRRARRGRSQLAAHRCSASTSSTRA